MEGNPPGWIAQQVIDWSAWPIQRGRAAVTCPSDQSVIVPFDGLIQSFSSRPSSQDRSEATGSSYCVLLFAPRVVVMRRATVERADGPIYSW
jgi:hypothetical protein